MEPVHMRLTGSKATVLIAGLLALGGYRFYSRFQSVYNAGRNAASEWLVRDYQGRGPKDVMKRIADLRAGQPVASEKALVPMNVEFVSVSAHGLNQTMVLRAEMRVDGGPPPDGQAVRYFRLVRKYKGGWMVAAETDSYAYYRALI